MQLQALLNKFKGELEQEPPSLNQALRRAAVFGVVDDLQALIEFGADINDKDPSKQRTAIHNAILHGKLSNTEFLYKKGADIQCLDSTGLSAAQLVKKSNNQEWKSIFKPQIGENSRIYLAIGYAEKMHFYPKSKCKILFENLLQENFSSYKPLEVEIALFIRKCARSGELNELCFLISILSMAKEREILEKAILMPGPTSGKNALDFLFEGVVLFDQRYPWQGNGYYFAPDIPVEYQHYQNEYLLSAILLMVFSNWKIPLGSFNKETQKIIAQNHFAHELFTFCQQLVVLKEEKNFTKYVAVQLQLFDLYIEKGTQKNFEGCHGICNSLPFLIASNLEIKLSISKQYEILFKENKGKTLNVLLLACGISQELLSLIELANENKVKLNVLAVDQDEEVIIYSKLLFRDIIPVYTGVHEIKFIVKDALTLDGTNKFDIISMQHPDFAINDVFEKIITNIIPKVSSSKAIVSISTYWKVEHDILLKIMRNNEYYLNPIIIKPNYRPFLFQVRERDDDEALVSRKFFPPGSFKITTYSNEQLKPGKQREALRKSA